MFLHRSVSYSVHRGICIPAGTGTDTPPPGRYIPACTEADTPHGQTHLSMQWGRHPPGRHIPACTGADTPPGSHPPGRHPQADGYFCGRYASYWNAFLFPNVPVLFPVPVSFRFPYRMNKLLLVNPENSMFCQNFYETYRIWSVRGGGGSRRWRTGSVHLNILRLINSKTINIVTVRNISWGKVLCSHSSVILSMGSRYLVGGHVIPGGMYSGGTTPWY